MLFQTIRCSRLFIFFSLISIYPSERLLRKVSKMVTSLWNFPKHLARYTLLPTSGEAKAGVQIPQTSFRRTWILLLGLSILINMICIWTLISPAGCTLKPILYCWSTQISKLLCLVVTDTLLILSSGAGSCQLQDYKVPQRVS